MLPMKQTVGWLVRTGTDDRGQPLYAAEVTVKCRAEPKARIIRNAQGEDVVSSLAVFTHAGINVGDAIRHDARTYPVLAAGDEPDMSGRIRYREVSL